MIVRPRHHNDNLQDHYQYIIEYLFKTHDTLDREEQVEVVYRNYLQSPLQPLADNLESATYETFENDSIKYDLYEEALFKAFLDKKKFGKFIQTKGCQGPQYVKFRQENESIEVEDEEASINSETQESPEIVVMYFGAGRGPLIRRALKAG